jgi:hypothetical protein
MAWLFDLLVQCVTDMIIYPIGAATGRLMLFVASFGRIRVAQDDNEAPTSWHGLRRRADGALAMHPDTVTFIGVMGWLILAAPYPSGARRAALGRSVKENAKRWEPDAAPPRAGCTRPNRVGDASLSLPGSNSKPMS